MSLSDELRNKDSRLNLWLRMHAKSLLNAGTFMAFMKVYPLVRKPVGTIPALAGTAFDYLFRWEVRELNPFSLAAHLGAQHIGRRRIVPEIVTIGDKYPDLRPACCIVLAWFDQIVRGNTDLLPSLKSSVTALMTSEARQLIDDVPAATRDDVAELRKGIRETLGDELSKPMIGNPVFAGSRYIGGADGDWILGKTLYDCKVTWQQDAMKAAYVTQLGIYALLDWDDEYKLDSIAVYLPRQRMVERLPLSKLFPDLAVSREAFKRFLLNG